jgi:hypothetical protein
MTDTAGRSGYLPVWEHGLIGDLHCVALAGTNGTIDWHCGPSFDAPSMFGSLLDADRGAGEAAVRALLDRVRPGGLLLAACHDLDDEHREQMKSRGTDPADYVGADDLGQFLGDEFTVELHAAEPRVDPPPDTPHIADVVLRARRR